MTAIQNIARKSDFGYIETEYLSNLIVIHFIARTKDYESTGLYERNYYTAWHENA